MKKHSVIILALAISLALTAPFTCVDDECSQHSDCKDDEMCLSSDSNFEGNFCGKPTTASCVESSNCADCQAVRTCNTEPEIACTWECIRGWCFSEADVGSGSAVVPEEHIACEVQTQ